MDKKEIRWKGRVVLKICGKEIRSRGRLIRIGFLEGEGYTFLDDPQTALQAIQESGRGIDLFTFIQKLSDTTPKYSYPIEWDNWAVLRISTFDDWMTKQVGSKVRTKVRKAEKHGVTVREASFDDAYVRGIHTIYNESPIRQGKPYWHYGKDLEAVRQMNATFIDRSIFIGAYFEGGLIGFGKLVFEEDRVQAGLMQIVSMTGHQEKAPTNALIAQAVRSCAERGIPYLWYGNMSNGKKQHDSLAEFKKHNGFQRMELPRYYVPLTLAGRMALLLGLHHSLAERVPEPLAAPYRRIRRLWYARSFPGPKNAALAK
jgi:hypothetical protein